jgi:asparagine synthase (glutamine-hydrolysing)
VITSTSNDSLSPVFLACFDVDGRVVGPKIRIGEQHIWRPADSEDWVAAQGYVANRAELLHRFGLPESGEDREILHLVYTRCGLEAANHIAGTLAWVLWDSRQRQVVMARDRMGNHNWYFTTLGDELWFSNRIEALLGLPGLPRSLNPRSVAVQIMGGVPLPGETFYESIREVLPGGFVRLDGQGRQEGRYWQIVPQPTLKLKTDQEYAQALRELLFRLVAEHAPPGQASITLSSGLDSTSVAAAICHAAPQTSLAALCWSAPELPEADESRFAAEVCRFLGIPYTEIRADRLWPMCRPDGICTSAMMPIYGYYTELFDETFQAARRQGSKVVFSGLSGDHLFGGNVFAYPDLLLTGRWLELARQIQHHLPRSSMRLSLYQIMRRMILSPIRQAYLPGRKNDAPAPVSWLRPPYDELYRSHFTRPPEFRWMLPGRLARLHMIGSPNLPHFAEMMNRHAESQGIEFRHPLLDHRLLEFAASLPTDQTFRAAQRKIIVRNAMQGLLPPVVLEMWDKILPGAITHRGLREREQSKVLHLMTDMRAAELGFVDQPRLLQAYQDYLAGRNNSAIFWNTLTLEDWLRRWF